ncbi:DUF4231 domain-containing protein [Hyalangium rubrum]|uniref:DUF4231 domain-containing protein n=1 Tax=Hyalangium rubrum TaxID=3103134 RepID=A0ABU5HH01_9BACT|nr:DUF4231 domain-containing protein [Hyalangium sp. s54d21]MDY7231370.1 DUF4231 domain-containing protein [Hyalangium sp. s54d21]
MQPSEPGASGEIHFPNGNRARWVRAAPEAEPRELLHELGLSGPPRSLILLLGGADALDAGLNARLQQLFSRGIARAAAETGALVLDGGTQSGVMALMGQGVADRGHRSTLVGVAPAGRVTAPESAAEGDAEPRVPLEPNHSHFVLVDSDAWGGETQTLYKLASTLAGDAPVVVVLVNGGALSKQEVLRAVRRGWAVVVVQGSGRLADEVAALMRKRPRSIEDPVLAEIVSDGDLCLFPLEGSPRELKRLISRELREDSILKLAWQRFATYDANAMRQQRIFKRIQFWSLFLGLLGTLAVLVKNALPRLASSPALDLGSQALIVTLAAAVTALVSASSRFKFGAKWIVLRAHAEAIKREIYRYRCSLGGTVEHRPGRLTCEHRLASRMKSISRQLMRTEANLSALRSYTGRIPPPSVVSRGDDGFSALTPSQYIRFRLDEQLNYYRRRIDALDRQASRLQWSVIGISAVGTVLGAVGQELWISLTMALVMALTAWLGFQQAENRLMKYHQAATDLDNLKAWWSALSIEAMGLRRNFDALVENTELVLQGELTGWVHEMKDVVSRLPTQQEKAEPEDKTKTMH